MAKIHLVVEMVLRGGICPFKRRPFVYLFMYMFPINS